MANEPGGTKFAQLITEIDLDRSKYDKKLDESVEAANLATIKIEKAFKQLGIRTDASYEQQRVAITTFYKKIINDANVSANERAAAEDMLAKKIEAINNRQYSARRSMDLAQRKAEEDSVKQRDQLWTNMGVRSNAQINAQKQQVLDSYNQLKSGAQGNHTELLRLEAGKNEKLKRLNEEMTGHHEMSMASMTRAVLRLYAAYYVLSAAIQGILAPLEKGFKAVETFNTSVASMAAMVVSFSERQKGMGLADQWQQALTYSKQLIPVLETLAAKTLLSGEETTALADAFARSGVFINTSNAAQIEGFTRISNALPLMTKGQEIMRQINTEIRGLMTGQNEQSSMMLTTLKAIPGFSQENLRIWRAQGTVMENVGKLLEGFGPATAILENQWQAVKSTIDTTVTQILRGVMKPVYEEIIQLTKDLNDWLIKNKNSLQEFIDRLVMMKKMYDDLTPSGTGFAVTGGIIGRLLFGSTPAGVMIGALVLASDMMDRLGVKTWKAGREAEMAAAAYAVMAKESGMFGGGSSPGGVGRDFGVVQPKPGPLIPTKEELEAAKKVAEYRNTQELSWMEYSEKMHKEYIEGMGKDYDENQKKEIKSAEESAKYIAAQDEKWREYEAKMQEEYYEGIADWEKKSLEDAKKAAEEKSKIPQHEADEARKMVTFYNDLNNMEEEYRNAKLNWIEKEAALKKSKGVEEIAIAKWVAAEKVKLDREQMDAVATKFDYDNKYVNESIKNAETVFENASQLFDKESSQYRLMQDAKKAMQIAEIAMTIQKNLAILASMPAVIAAKEAEAVAGGAAAVTTQGSGDPYTAFARIAAMIAIVGGVLAAAGIASSMGGGGSASASAPSAYAFSNTVLGGAAGVGSESIANSWELLQDTYDMEYRELSGIYNQMKSLNSNITGLVTSIIRTGSVNGPDVNVGFVPSELMNRMDTWFGGIGHLLGNTTGWVAKIEDFLSAPAMQIGKWLFGGGTESWVAGGGLTLGGNSARNLMAGGSMGAGTYTTVGVHEDGGWFGSDSDYSYNVYGQLNADVSALLNKVFQNMSGTLIELSKGLGQDVNAAMNYVFSGTSISLYGLDAEGISKTLNEYFSAAGDAAVNVLFGALLKPYQNVGEGLLETAQRVMIDKAVVMENLRMTNQAYEGTIPELIKFSEALITVAGGLDKLTESMQTYYDKFFSDSEKQADLKNSLSAMMSTYGFSLPSQREGYRALVESLNLTTDAGMNAYVSLMNMSESADQYYKYLEDAKSKISPEGYSTRIEYQRALAGLPKYADGGYFAGGYRIVGENGPEIEYTGPSRIYSNQDSKSLVNNNDLISEIRALREEIGAGNFQIAASTQKSAKLLQYLEQWDDEGIPTTRQ